MSICTYYFYVGIDLQGKIISINDIFYLGRLEKEKKSLFSFKYIYLIHLSNQVKKPFPLECFSLVLIICFSFNHEKTSYNF